MADKEYIEREALLKVPPFTKCAGAIDDYVEGYLDCVEDATEAINKMPTADVVEVRHGEWVEHFAFDCWHYDCPFCDDGYATKERDKYKPNYCHNCGAKMDGKGDK